MPHSISRTDTDFDDEDVPILLKPRPRRQFELSSSSRPSTPSPTSPDIQSPPSLKAPTSNAMDEGSAPPRTISIMNLTSPTLFGIFQTSGDATDREEPGTPWGTGAETPIDGRRQSVDSFRASLSDTILLKGQGGPKLRRKSALLPQGAHHKPRRGFKGYLLPMAGRTVALFAAGVLYGLLITHLHDKRDLAPVRVEMDRSRWSYLVWWGTAGVVLGQALPWIDARWAAVVKGDSDEDEEQQEAQKLEDERRRSEAASSRSGLEGWMDVVRSIGAFVGIAFAIRKLAWQSTLQLSLTLALANPAVWYLIDRSPPGFMLSALVAVIGTLVLIGINPGVVPSPSPAPTSKHHGLASGRRNDSSFTINLQPDDLVLGIFSHESIGVATWIASVLFVSSVCFGNIGRRLAPRKG